jgi:lysophospholipase L1-like esterase
MMRRINPSSILESFPLSDTPATHKTTPPSRPFLIPVLAIALLLGAVLGALEVGARILLALADNPSLNRLTADYGRLAQHGADWIRFVPDHDLSYRLRPGFVTAAATGSGQTAHNADGFRAQNDFSPKRLSTLRICCYGGSTTYGVGVDDNRDTYPSQLRKMLENGAREAGWEGVEVYNLGVGGYTSREILGTMKRTLPQLNPDVVLIQNAVNDVIPRFYPDFEADYSHFRTPFTPLEMSPWRHAAYRSRAWLILAHGLGWAKPLSLQSQTQRPMPPIEAALSNLESNAPAAFENNLQAAVLLARDRGAKVWLLTQAYLDVPDFAGPNEAARRLESGYRKGLAEHTGIVVALSAKTTSGLVPIHELMPRERKYFTDPIHMSRSGNEAKANLISEALIGALPSPST